MHTFLFNGDKTSRMRLYLVPICLFLMPTEVGGLSCVPGDTMCSDESGCYTVADKCNGHRVCCNWQDERHCSCPPGQVYCYGNMRGCTFASNCDRRTPVVTQIPPKSTPWIPGCREPGWITPPAPTGCPPNTRMCPIGLCTHSSIPCYMVTPTQTTKKYVTRPIDCSSSSKPYHCQDGGGCFSYYAWCDGYLDCRDISDERNCELKVNPYFTDTTSTNPETTTPFFSLENMFSPNSIWFVIVLGVCGGLLLIAIIVAIASCVLCRKKKEIPPTGDAKGSVPVTYTVDMAQVAFQPNGK